MVKEFVLWFVLFVLLFVVRVIFFGGNFEPCFFQSFDKWVYAFDRKIFIFKVYILLFLYMTLSFSLTATYDIPILQVHARIYFLLVSFYIINVNQ